MRTSSPRCARRTAAARQAATPAAMPAMAAVAIAVTPAPAIPTAAIPQASPPTASPLTHNGALMDPISYERAADVNGALRSAQEPGSMYIGGGTNLLDLMKGGGSPAMRLIDI